MAARFPYRPSYGRDSWNGFTRTPWQSIWKEAGLSVEQQAPIRVRYKDQSVGEYIADLLVAGRVLVELNAVRALDDSHSAQCLNDLSAIGLPVCLLLNFGTPRVGIKRLSL